VVAAVATLGASLGLVSIPVGSASAADFGAGNLVVVRMGDGSGALSGNAAAEFLDEYSPNGTLVQSVALPTTTSGSNRRLTDSGSATSTGSLNRSADGRYLTLAGYDAAPGTAGVVASTSAATNRVIARVGADGAVDTSTALSDAYSASNIRGVVTDDGSRFWTAGTGAASFGGVRYATLGATTSTQVTTAPTNVRTVGIAAGQLYAGSGSAPFIGVSRVGDGLPTGPATATSLFTPSGTSPYGFVLLDRDPAVPGVDSAYLADDSAGLLKYSFDGSTWTARGSLAGPIRGLTGSVTGSGVQLYATSSSNALLAIGDAAGYDQPLAATATTIASAPANTAFRGVAFAPVSADTPPTAPAITTQPAATTIAPGETATLTVAATGSTPLSYQWYAGAAGDTSTGVGSNSASFTTPALTETASYWVRISNAVGAVDSQSATVTVEAPPAACTVTPTPIPAVQGSGPAAAITGPVTVRGVVVGDYEGPQPQLRGFYLQDPAGDGDPATSDGIFVFDNGANSVSNGQVVEVTGSAGEFQDQTQITAASVDPCPDAAPATVEPVDVTLPVASPTALERYEGMLVRLHQTLTVTEHFQLGRFGQVVVSSGGRLKQPTNLYPAADPRTAQLAAANALNRLIIDDADQAQNPDPIVFGRDGNPLSAANTLRGGDTVTDPVGVLTYTWAGNAASGNAYRLRPSNALGGQARFTAVNQRPTAAPAVGNGSLKVASANLLNYFNTFSGCTFGAGGAAADCRGAEDSVEFERQAAKEIAALTTVDADVIGIMEMENDGYGPGSAIQDLVNRLNAATAPGTWAFVDPDAALGGTNVAGDDAIKVGLLYKPAKVTPVPGATFADLTPGAYERHPVAQTFVTPTGARATVVANHFKSKGCDGATGANLDAGDGQGCFNARRVAEAHSLASFISGTVIPGAGDPDVLIVGDLNSYAKEDPIAVLEAAGFVNLVEAFGGPDAYSYAFDGTWGYLDHALASASLRPQVTGAGDYHINADEPSVLDYNTNFKTPAQIASLYAPDRYRTSDHDSIRVGFNLAVTKSASTTTVTSSANPATLGQSARYTATVKSAVPGLTPTGTVRFYVAGVPYGLPVPVTAAGTAVSGSLSLPLPSQFVVEARYSGSTLSEASTGRVSQRVEYGLPAFVSPAAGATVVGGSVVPLRFTLTDSAGRPLSDLASTVLALTCQVKVSVTGAQTLAPTCARYDAARNQFNYDWRSARTPRGSVQLTVAVPISGGAAQTRTVTLTVS
jgi:predicted extracellular nuclease